LLRLAKDEDYSEGHRDSVNKIKSLELMRLDSSICQVRLERVFNSHILLQ